jgi:hypothetical protein
MFYSVTVKKNLWFLTYSGGLLAVKHQIFDTYPKFGDCSGIIYTSNPMHLCLKLGFADCWRPVFCLSVKDPAVNHRIRKHWIKDGWHSWGKERKEKRHMTR